MTAKSRSHLVVAAAVGTGHVPILHIIQ